MFYRYDAVNEYYQTVYVKPYMRWNAYLIGIFVAYVLLRTERHPNAMGLKVLRIGVRAITYAYTDYGPIIPPFQPVNVAAWAAIVAICSCIIYGLYGFSIGQQLSAAAVIIYASFARTVWALVIGLLVILCLRTAKGRVIALCLWMAGDLHDAHFRSCQLVLIVVFMDTPKSIDLLRLFASFVRPRIFLWHGQRVASVQLWQCGELDFVPVLAISPLKRC